MSRAEVSGYARPDFAPVWRAFEENFTRRNELGGACCIYKDGEKVVDLWGGIQDRASGARWKEDTMVLVFSATKGMSALALALAHSRGLLDYEERVSAYWPEFAQAGKERMTVRQLLAHQGGLFAIDEPVDREVLADLDRLAVVLARQKPAWPPGSRQAYHALSLGFFEGELLRRVDPLQRSLGQYFDEEIAKPLGAEFYIRLPKTLPDSRLAVLDRPGILKTLWSMPLPMTLAALNPRSPLYRALMINPGSLVALDDEHVYLREVEVPSGGGVGTARGMARAYQAFVAAGGELGIRAETIGELEASAVPSEHGFYDEALRGEVPFSLGFMKPSPNWPFGHAGAFGAPGAGGSLGYADPEAGIAYAYVTNRMGPNPQADPRDRALRDALARVVG